MDKRLPTTMTVVRQLRGLLWHSKTCASHDSPRRTSHYYRHELSDPREWPIGSARQLHSTCIKGGLGLFESEVR